MWGCQNHVPLCVQLKTLTFPEADWTSKQKWFASSDGEYLFVHSIQDYIKSESIDRYRLAQCENGQSGRRDNTEMITGHIDMQCIGE